MRGNGGLARVVGRLCRVPSVVGPSASIIPRTMRGARTAEVRSRAARNSTRPHVRTILLALVHTLNSLENQRFLNSMKIVKVRFDSCQVLWHACCSGPTREADDPATPTQQQPFAHARGPPSLGGLEERRSPAGR